MITIIRFALCLALTPLAGLAHAQPGAGAAPLPVTLPQGVVAGPAVEGVFEYRLANGLRVLLIPDPSQESITTNVTYLVGSRHEGYGEAGMAHLLEHMLFKGSPRHPNIKGEFLARGARYNGTTSFDRTNYFQTFPASEDNLAWAIELEADRMVNSNVSKEDLESEMTVVRNEFEAGENSPFALLRERVAAAAYAWHNYGRSVIGSRSDIENVPIERLRAFYRHYYQPDNAALIIAGRFEPARALALTAEHFGHIARPERALRTTYTAEPPQDGERQVILRRVGKVQLVSAMYHMPAGTHPDYPAIDILTQVIGSSPAGRLHKALIEPGKAVFVFGVERQLRETGSAYFGAGVRQDASLEAARDVLLSTIEGVAKAPITDEEVQRARQAILSEIEKTLRSTRTLATTLSEFIALGDWRILFWYRDRLEKITTADVQAAAERYLRPQNRTLGLFYPAERAERVEIPRAPDLARTLGDYKGRAQVSAGEAFEASPENIEKRVVRRTLQGGMRLALLPKKTRGGTVAVNLDLRWGSEEAKRDRSMACTLAGSMLVRGTTRRSRTEIRDELSRLRSNVNVMLEGGTIDTTREHLGATLELVAEMLRMPAFPESEFQQLRDASLTSLDFQRTDPASLASLQLSRHLHPYPKEHWLYQPALDERAERLKTVNLEDVKRCHAELVGASDAEMSIVGDFDPQEMTALVERLFGDWKSPQPYRRVQARYHEVDPLDRLIETPDKANASFRAGMKLRVRDDHPDFPALILGNYLLGGSSDSRLARRAREKEGISYSVASWVRVGSQDPIGEFGVSAIFAPENRARLERAIREEIEQVLREGFRPEELEAAKTGLLHQRRLARNNDAALAARLANYLMLDRTFRWDIEFEQRIAALTGAEVQAALGRHLQPKRLSIVRAGDFARVASAPPVGASPTGAAAPSEAASN